MAKGAILAKILTTISDRTIDFYDIFEGFVVAGYGASMRKMEYEHDRRHWKRVKERREREDQRESKRRLQQYISKLKSDGLIEQTNNNQFTLTSKGLIKLQKLESRPPIQDFEISESPNAIIISFDIPEKYRKNRNWFRGALKFLNFRMVHRSTWVGQMKIPEKLIEQLNKMEILKYIKIFEVTKIGTLKELK